MKGGIIQTWKKKLARHKCSGAATEEDGGEGRRYRLQLLQATFHNPGLRGSLALGMGAAAEEDGEEDEFFSAHGAEKPSSHITDSAML